MIENILIKNVASYDNGGTQLSGLKKINFIYGANGSGKTTISNLSSGQTNLGFKDCNLQWKDGQVLNSLVYNKKFRENNFGKGKIEGVFTLGEATKEDMLLIKEKQKDLNVLKDEGLKKKDTLDKQNQTKSDEEVSFKESVWVKIYKKLEGEFKEAFQGSMQKESFKNKLLSEFKTNRSSLQTFDDLKKKSKTIFGQAPEPIEFINIVNFNAILTIEKDDIWGDKIIGKSDVDISRLIQKLNINDWVNQGRSYIQDNLTCPFCQQPTIEEDFKNKLESYFDESFTTSIKKITVFIDEYKRFTENIINELTQIEASQKSNDGTKLDIDKFSAYLKTLLSQINANKVLLAEKTKEPSRSLTLTPTKEQFENIKNLVESANGEIKKHNDIVNNYKSERSGLIQAVCKYSANPSVQQ